jgi:hypothetical protein
MEQVKRVMAAGVLVIVILTVSAVGAANSAHPDVAGDRETGALADLPAVSEIQACPEKAIVPEGSLCQLTAVNESESFWKVVQMGVDRPFCDRAIPPEGADPATCRVVEEVEHGSPAPSALVEFETADGHRVRVWIMPGEGNQIVFA